MSDKPKHDATVPFERDGIFVGPEDMMGIERELRSFPPDSRLVIEREREVNCLRLDTELRTTVVSVPHFLPEKFQHFGVWHESNFQASTFRLADLLEMLPGQINNNRAIFELRRLRSHGHLYGASCSRLRLAAFICQNFYSLSEEEGHIEIRTTLGRFNIFPQGLSATIQFPQNKAPNPHRLATGDFKSIQRFAEGKIRMSPDTYQRAYGLEGDDDERWLAGPMNLAISTPGLDHPSCIRFATQAELKLLETNRELCGLIIRVFIRHVNEEPPNGIDAIEHWELIMKFLEQSKDVRFVYPDTVKTITKIYWVICTIVSPDENTRIRMLSNVVDDLGEMLHSLWTESSIRSIRIKDYLKELVQR